MPRFLGWRLLQRDRFFHTKSASRQLTTRECPQVTLGCHTSICHLKGIAQLEAHSPRTSLGLPIREGLT